MSIALLSCAYAQNSPVNLKGKSKDILAMKWLVKFSNGTWKKYQLTLYIPSNKKKYGTISKALSSKKRKENIETTYIQINNLEAVQDLQKKAEAIKINIKFRETKESDLPDLARNDSEDHFIDPNAFVDSKEHLLFYPKSKELCLPNYHKIKQYLEKHIEKQIKATPKASPKKEKPEINEDDKENISPSSDLANAPRALKSNSRIKSISSCCNLKFIAAIIFALSVSLLGHFYKNQNLK
ncbi:MAG: hypothetical protein KR126chlam5_00011 [Candidatus Anoxychlamydiales bacterium]|nr:hypothetical protein [Candidatus Anoxychlamydiales bacterium]